MVLSIQFNQEEHDIGNSRQRYSTSINRRLPLFIELFTSLLNLF